MIRQAQNDEFGVLVIRVWHERGNRNAFRARLIYGGGGDQDTDATALTTDRDAVLDAVRRWLDEQERIS